MNSVINKIDNTTFDVNLLPNDYNKANNNFDNMQSYGNKNLGNS